MAKAGPPVHDDYVGREFTATASDQLWLTDITEDGFNRYTDTLALEGLQPSIGSVGDAYDNAAAETVMGLFKNEAVAKDSPFRSGALKTEADVMEIVFEWVHWYNTQRLHSSLEHQTP